ncbi:methyltransferase [Saccharothrix xinjiangensis]|uniref:Methyltransferase n=1 Tax=Saccharothrix xinjiangensis TaxID=204798 RepID=A0ABV9YBY2_9PSEU
MADLNAELRRKIMGYIVSQAIMAVNELRIPDRLDDGPVQVDRLASEAGCDRDALRRFLRVLVGEGLFTFADPDTFGLTDMGALLCTRTPASPGNFAELMGGEAYASWAAAAHSLRTGEPAFDHLHGARYFDWLATDPDAAHRFNRAQSELVRLRSVPLLERDWAGTRTVVDVGGGNGALVAALLARHTTLRAAVFDLPDVVEEARKVLAAAGLDGRADVVPGDFFTDVPRGADVYVLSQVLHDWDDEDAGRILRRCRTAVPGHGRLLVVEQVLGDGCDAGPTALLDLHMLVLLGGRERTRSDWAALLGANGFTIDEIRTGPRSSLIEAVPT